MSANDVGTTLIYSELAVPIQTEQGSSGFIAVAARARFFFFQAEDGIRDYKVTGVQTCALPISHRVSMSSAYTLWFDPEQERNRHTRIVWRQSLYDIDSWAIPAGSPRRDDAYRFIAFASSPERQKALSEQLTYGPTNRNALGLLPARLAGTLPSSTPNLSAALRIDAAFWIEHGDALERRFNSWAPAICRQQVEEGDDDYFGQPVCQDAEGNMRVSRGP